MRKYVPFIIVALIAAGAGFWGGTVQASKRPAADSQARATTDGFGGGSGGRNGGGQGGAGFRGGRGGDRGGFVGGQVLSKDDTSVTVKLQDGGSKIILLSSASTKIYKAEEVKVGDIAVGDQVTATGAANSDGSITANMVQIRPPQPTAPVISEAGAREITITAKNFVFDPAEVRVKQGEKIKLTLVNGDGTHGIGIPAFNVSIKPPAGGSASQVFIADQKGSFPFLCDVFCGEGHRDMQGTLIVE